LKLQSEEVISLLEKTLIHEKEKSSAPFFKEMTESELHDNIDKSEVDFQKNRFKESQILLDKYK
jgi:hypothetical protein